MNSTERSLLNRKLVAAFGAATLALAAGPAASGIITDTGATFSATDPSWSVAWRALDGSSSGYQANAPLITGIPSPPWEPNAAGTNNWIGANSAGSVASVGDGIPHYEYAFTTSIDVTTQGETVTGALGYDNFFVGGFVDGSLNTSTGTYTPGTQFLSATSLLGAGNENKAGFCRDGDGFLPSSSFPNCTVNFAFTFPDLTAGIHTITFLIEGDGVTDGFILNQKGVTTSVPEPATLSLLGLGLAGVGFMRRRRKS